MRRHWFTYLAIFGATYVVAAVGADALADHEDPLRGYTDKTSSGLVGVIDNAEVCHSKATRRFTASVPELERTMRRLAPTSVGARLSDALDEAEVKLELHASDNGRYYTQRVTGDHIDQALSRNVDGFVSYDSVRPSDACKVPGR